MNELPWLIVGQGLAGTTLARRMEWAGIPFRIMHHANGASASRVAAGVWNPVVVRRYVKSWMADNSLAEASVYYKAEEGFFGANFFHTCPLNKLLSNEQERKEFEKRYQTGQLSDVMDEKVHHDFPDEVIAPQGAARVRQAGYLDVAAYLDICCEYWKKKGVLLEDRLEYDALKQNGTHWEYRKTSYQGIIFCEGAGASQNPWLKDLPFRHTKGEILRLDLGDFSLKECLNKQIFLMPLADGFFRAGATYGWEPLDTEPTVSAREELLAKLEHMIRIKPTVLEQVAGIRPTLADRRPVVGEVPGFPGLWTFNGLGSRGVLLAPYLSELLLLSLGGGKNLLPGEACLQRFFS